MTVKIIPFKKEHLECMDVRQHEIDLIGDIDHLTTLEASSIACTGIIDGQLMCCGGITPFNNGTANIWLIPSVYVSGNKMIFARHLRKWLFKVREDLALLRMQSACLDDDLHNNWMTFLGFTKEGTMKKYHNGVDYNMWGRTWE